MLPSERASDDMRRKMAGRGFDDGDSVTPPIGASMMPVMKEAHGKVLTNCMIASYLDLARAKPLVVVDDGDPVACRLIRTSACLMCLETLSGYHMPSIAPAGKFRMSFA